MNWISGSTLSRFLSSIANCRTASCWDLGAEANSRQKGGRSSSDTTLQMRNKIATPLSPMSNDKGLTLDSARRTSASS
eukprot:scaffold10110_cov451-Chaetoceros_neogracile.AAC.1